MGIIAEFKLFLEEYKVIGLAFIVFMIAKLVLGEKKVVKK